MELHAQNIVFRDSRHQSLAVIGERENIRRIIGCEVVGMEEIGLARIHHRVLFSMRHERDIVPAHMRDLDARIGRFDKPHLAINPAQPRRLAMLQSAIGKQLHPDTNAKERRAAHVNTLGHGLDHTGQCAKPFGTSLEAADTG